MNAHLNCPNCGQSLEPGLKICPHCGAVLGQPARREGSSTSRFAYFLLQFVLALGILLFGGMGACSAYFLATRQTASEMGDLSGLFWMSGLFGLACCAACVYFARRIRKR